MFVFDLITKIRKINLINKLFDNYFITFFVILYNLKKYITFFLHINRILFIFVGNNVNMDIKDDCNNQEKWFESEVQIYEGQPAGFEDWTKGIVQCRYTIYLPDGTRTTAKLFMDHQKIFDNFEYTRYLINRYNEANG